MHLIQQDRLVDPLQVDIRGRNIRGRQFKVIRQFQELYVEVLSSDFVNSYQIRLGAALKYTDKVITAQMSTSGNYLAVGIDRADKGNLAQESYLVLLFSFQYNTTVWVKQEYMSSSLETSRLRQLLIDEDNELVYACGDLSAVYYKG